MHGHSPDGVVPTITVVVPAYNRAKMLPRALEGIHAQFPVRATEVLVIDDASTDGSAEVAEALGATVLRMEANGGPALARDRGLATARGEWCALLDSDDRWAPSHLTTLLAAADPDTGLVASSGIAVVAGRPYVTGNPFSRPVRLQGASSVLRPENVVTTSACMVRTGVARRVGGFGRERLAEDLDLWMRILSDASGVLVPDITVRYGTHGSQTSQDAAMQETARRVVDRHPEITVAARRALATTARWDRFRAELRARRLADAARSAATLAAPPAMRDLPALLYHRRSRRTRWADRLDELAWLLEPDELAVATHLASRRRPLRPRR